MKVAIFSDVHANLEALNAVIDDADEQGCQKYVCLGDVVGYNGNPVECIEKLQEIEAVVIKGNHDEDSCSNNSLDHVNQTAKTSLLWTRNQLSNKHKEWLSSLNFIERVEGFSIVHATLDQPSFWSYVSNKFDAMSSFSYQFTQVCFHGHTHVPRVFVNEKGLREVDPTVIKIEENKRYFINTGAVGQPRNQDWRSSYCIYDLAKQEVSFRQVSYNVELAQKKILDLGLPKILAQRLAEGL